MGQQPRTMSPWLASLMSWVLAAGLIAGVYAAWQYFHEQPIRWDLVLKASVLVAPLALFRAWRDRARKE